MYLTTRNTTRRSYTIRLPFCSFCISKFPWPSFITRTKFSWTSFSNINIYTFCILYLSRSTRFFNKLPLTIAATRRTTQSTKSLRTSRITTSFMLYYIVISIINFKFPTSPRIGIYTNARFTTWTSIKERTFSTKAFVRMK